MPGIFALFAVVVVQHMTEVEAVNFCGSCVDGGPPPMTPNRLQLQCSTGSVISTVQFASYGTPTGTCGNYQTGSCNAANSSSIVNAACLSAQSCTIWPNTSTFGDPCFGTQKNLVVQWECSNSGMGNATCFDQPPPAPPQPNVTVQVTSAYSSPDVTVSTIPSLQVVSQRLLLPWSGSIYTAAWAGLKHLADLGLKSVRFVPWIPYARMGVAELDPPTAVLCGPRMWQQGQQGAFNLDCGTDGGTISSVDFASFGNAGGQCGSYTKGSCEDPLSAQTVTAACVGKQSCALGPDMFSHSCDSVQPYLAVSARCSNPAKTVFTYWNFTWVDQLALDFWTNVNGDASMPIPNWSTQPTWLYDQTDFAYVDDPTVVWYGYDRGTAPAANLTALGDYYGRLLSWYVNGGFTDEAGIYHSSGHALNITMYEIGNEVDYEHGHTPASYCADYDATVAGIRRWLGPKAAGTAIRYVGLSLPNIDASGTVQRWVSYFLNASNHDPAVWDAVTSGFIGFHSYPTGDFGPWTSDPTSFEGMFRYVDAFMTEVQAVVNLTSTLAPDVRLCLDESGVDMDNVLEGGVAPPNNNPRFWVAGASYFAYLYSKAAALGDAIHVVAQSQFMDAPGQEPSVSMLDWTTGAGTAKYWVNELLLRTTASGDVYVNTGTNDTATLHAQAFQHGNVDSLLLISKVNAFVSVVYSWTGGSSSSVCSALCVDETTGLEPARTVPCTSNAGETQNERMAGAGSLQIDLFPFATCVVQLQ